MVNPASCQFANYRSVRFNVDNFALPVVVSQKKNTIYTNYLTNLKGTKNQLTSLGTPQSTYGYDHVTQWGHYIFASDDEHGLMYTYEYNIDFQPLEELVYPKQLAVVGDRLFLISYNQKRIVYSVDLKGEWSAKNFLDGFIYLPVSYGLCLDIRYYRGKLLVVCENGLLTINRNFVLEHLDDDSEVLKANLAGGTDSCWESNWFSLGYATNTQTLREIFLKTNVNLILTATSNRTQRNIQVKAADNVQKVKVNLNGDQFKLRLSLSDSNAVVSDLAAVVGYGKRG